VTLVGAPVRRRRDVPLLRGEASFVGDLAPAGALHLTFVRSPHAHARILRIDASAARAVAGVTAVYAAADLDPLPGPLPVRVGADARFEPFLRPALARDTVRYVGEVVAVVAADSRYVAEDAAALVEVDYEPLDAVVDALAAAEPGSPLLFPPAGTNVVDETEHSYGDVDEAFAAADVVVGDRFRTNRHTAVPMETRGLVADWDGETLTVWGPTKALHAHRQFLAQLLGLQPENVRVVEPAVGGGFGVRGEQYPEDVIVPLLAVRLGLPVRWVEDRGEHLVATNHSREQVHDAELALAADGTILALRSSFVVDTGAYVASLGVRIADGTAHALTGPYRIAAHATVARTVVTNKTPIGTYRAPGRYEANFVRERLIDLAAQRLGIDAVELRRRNLLRVEDMPFEPGLSNHGEAVVYESGDALGMLDAALDAAAVDRPAADGPRRLGVGVACFMEDGGVGGVGHTPGEFARVAVAADGAVTVYSGVAELGQGFETVLAQVCADELGVDLEGIAVVSGDTERVESGGGTWGSRGAILAGNSTLLAAREVRERLEAGESPPLEASCTFRMPAITYAPGAHVAVVEVDPETGEVAVVRQALAYDIGRALNPLFVEAQINGGIAQGLGGVLLEELPYDEQGQPLAATLADYLLPSAAELPAEQRVVLVQSEPAPGNPLGVKAVGEVGPGAAGPAIANAVAAALHVDVCTLPLSPERVLDLLATEVT
jgi:carbon-monoxide dehydrogenase large subunit